jgi:hypothetical protein
MSEFSAVIDGVLHWRGFHEGIRQEVHSYYLTAPRLAIDPIATEGLADALAEQGGVERIALTNRHHLRGSVELAERFDCPILAPAAGMHEFPPGLGIEPYEWEDELARGVTAHAVAAICPDDGALHIDSGPGAIALADAVIAWDGELSFVPDFLMDEPDLVKPETTAALERLLELDFDAILLAHGEPISSGAKEALRAFVADPQQADFGV